MRLILCGCGCGTEIPACDSRGRQRRFVSAGHRYRLAPRVKIGATSRHTGYARSQRLVPTTDRCELEHIGACHGDLQRAHVDHNPLHNVSENIKVLCRRHHSLYDRGRIDLVNPVMPSRYFSGGSWRYDVRLVERTCQSLSCRQPFTSASKSQRYCSPQCAAAAKQATHKAALVRYAAKQRDRRWSAICRPDDAEVEEPA